MPRPTTAALLLTLAAALPMGLFGCATDGPHAAFANVAATSPQAPAGSLVLQLTADDFTPAQSATLSRSLQRRWAGTQLIHPGSANIGTSTDTGADTSADADQPHTLEVRLANPRKLNRTLRKALAGQPPREGTFTFAPDQAVAQRTSQAPGNAPITVLRRPAVTLTLVTPPAAPTDGNLRSGLARVTFDADYLDAVAQFDPDARPADALWLALRGLDAKDLRRLDAARAPLTLPDAVRLVDAGIDPAGLRQMERRGIIFRLEEWLALADAGLTPADALALHDAGTPATVATLTDAQAQKQQQHLADALEAQAAKQARLDAQLAAQAVAEAEAKAEQLEQDALALEAQRRAQAPALEVASEAARDASDPSRITPESQAESQAVSSTNTETHAQPQAGTETQTQAQTQAETQAVAVVKPAPPIQEPAATHAPAQAPPSYYEQLMAEQAEAQAEANAQVAVAIAAAPIASTSDAELLADPEDEAADPAESLVDAVIRDAVMEDAATQLAERREAADVDAPAQADAALAINRPIAAGDMIPTEPAERAVPARYVELLGKLNITRPAHVAALYQARVPPKLIHRFQQAGVRPSVIELIDAHRLDLDPAAAQTLTDAGYNITLYDLALLDTAGVDPSYAAALFDERFRPLTATQIVELWENRVSIADIREARTQALATPVSTLDH